MKTIAFPKFKDYTNQNVNFIQPKLDGHLCKIRKYSYKLLTLDPTTSQSRNLICATTKNDKDITEKLLAIKHIKEELNNLPCDSIVLAELHCPGVPATSVPTMLNNADERLELTAFAAPLLNDEDLFNTNLMDVLIALETVGINIACASRLKTGFVDKAFKDCLLKGAIRDKLEGWVLKESHMNGWYKLKPIKTVDAFVIGTQQSFSSTHYGGLQSVTVGVWRNAKIHSLGEVGGGFKLEFRKQLDTKEKRNSLLNRVCEVRYDSLAAKGKLRWPRFVRWRDDKNVNDCFWDQLEN